MAIQAVQAVVYRDNTLGVLGEAFGYPSVQILSSNKNGVHWSKGAIHFVRENEFRNATRQDFETFRVSYNEHYLVDNNGNDDEATFHS
jgi:hypothetical protein